jgi:prepilin-type N-terminal cleavage/methylation domain-containing protein
MKGYSLFEILVVLLLISILLKNLPKIEFSAKNPCNRLNNFLNNAQNKAILSGEPVTVELSSTQNIARELNSNNYFLFPKRSKIQALSFGNLAYGSNAITFEPELWSSPGSILITSSQNDRCKLYQSILGARRIE